jgi:hypothetical protein
MGGSGKNLLHFQLVFSKKGIFTIYWQLATGNWPMATDNWQLIYDIVTLFPRR